MQRRPVQTFVMGTHHIVILQSDAVQKEFLITQFARRQCPVHRRTLKARAEVKRKVILLTLHELIAAVDCLHSQPVIAPSTLRLAFPHFFPRYTLPLLPRGHRHCPRNLNRRHVLLMHRQALIRDIRCQI